MTLNDRNSRLRQGKNQKLSRPLLRTTFQAALIGLASTLALALGVALPVEPGPAAAAPVAGDGFVAFFAEYRTSVVAALALIAVASSAAIIALILRIRSAPVAVVAERAAVRQRSGSTSSAHEPDEAAHKWAFDARDGTFRWSGAARTGQRRLPDDYDSFLEAVDPRDRDAVQAAFDQAVEDGSPYDVEMRWTSSGGALRRVRMTGQMLPQRPRGQKRLVGVLVEEGAAERAGVDAAVVRRGVEQCSLPMAMADANGRLRFVNAAVSRETGFTADELTGRRPHLLRTGAASRIPLRDLWRTVGSGNTWRGNLRLACRTGERLWALVTVSPVRDDRGRIVHAFATIETVRRDARRDAAGRTIATVADMTGLANRVLAFDRLDEIFANAAGAGLTVAAIVVGFDDPADGEANGSDARLPESGLDRLLRVVPQESVVFRLGCGEFAVIVPEVSGDGEVDAVARALEQAFVEPVGSPADPRQLIVSLGVSRFPADGDNAYSLLHSAEAAMRRKRQGLGPPAIRHATPAEEAPRNRLRVGSARRRASA